MINIQWTKFEQKSVDSFISGELPKVIPRYWPTSSRFEAKQNSINQSKIKEGNE